MFFFSHDYINQHNSNSIQVTLCNQLSVSSEHHQLVSTSPTQGASNIDEIGIERKTSRSKKFSMTLNGQLTSVLRETSIDQQQISEGKQ